MTKPIIPVGGSLAEIEQFIETNFISKEEVVNLINDFSASEHSDNEAEKNISRGVNLLKNYLLRELKEDARKN